MKVVNETQHNKTFWCKKLHPAAAAFTLAEVLITLVVIGIIAAVTIPTLRNSLDENRYIIPLKKTYSVLSEAFDNYFNYNDDRLYIAYSQFHIFINELMKNLSVSRVCCAIGNDPKSESCYGQDTIYSKCFKQPVKNSVSQEHSISYFTDNYKPAHRASFFLKDGTSVGIIALYSADNEDTIENLFQNFGIRDTREFPAYSMSGNVKKVAFIVFVDVNGLKEPNTPGKDVHAFVYTKDAGLLVAGTDGNGSFSSCSTDAKGKYDNSGSWGGTFSILSVY